MVSCPFLSRGASSKGGGGRKGDGGSEAGRDWFINGSGDCLECRVGLRFGSFRDYHGNTKFVGYLCGISPTMIVFFFLFLLQSRTYCVANFAPYAAQPMKTLCF